MRGRVRWVGVVVTTSAIVGGAAAIVRSPIPSAAAAHVTTTTATRDVVTPEVTYLAAQAQQLGSEISAAQAELAHLRQQVADEASLSHFHVTIPPITRAPSVTTVTVAPRHDAPARARETPTTTSTSTTTSTTSTTSTTLAPATHATTRASGTGESSTSDSSDGNDN